MFMEKNKLHGFFIVRVFCVFLMVMWGGMAGASVEPLDLIRKSSDQIFSVLRAHGEADQLQGKIVSLATPHFDFERVTALAVGPEWRQAAATQKKQLTQAFQNLLIRVYGKTMLRFRDAQLELNDRVVFQQGGKRATVRSKVIFDKGSRQARVDYVLVKLGNSWKIIDVRVEGSSLVTVYRNQFQQKIKQSGGIDGLIRYLKARS